MHMGKGSNIQILYQDNIDRQTQNTHINEVGCVSLCSSCRLLENRRLIPKAFVKTVSCVTKSHFD